MKSMMNRKQYIGALKACLSARHDFGNLEYFKDNTTAEEYLILSDIVGHIFMFNITGMKEALIYHTLAQVECGKVPKNYIQDKAEVMRIAKLRR